MGHPYYVVETFRGAANGWQSAAATSDRGKAELWLGRRQYWQRKLNHRIREGFYGRRAES